MDNSFAQEHRRPELNPDISRYIVAGITTKTCGPLLLGPIPSGRLKNPRDADEWSSLNLCLSIGRMSVLYRAWDVLVQSGAES